MIFLLEEVTTPASLKALYSHFHFTQPGGSRTKRWRKDCPVFSHLLSKLLVTGRAFQKVNVHLASLNGVKNELSLARLQFFNYLARMFERFLKLYQTDAPMLPHMNGDLLELIKSVIRMFIKSEAIEACFNLTKFDLHNKEIRLKLSQIDIGFAADESLSNFRKKDIISFGYVKEFKIQYVKALISAIEQLFERCLLTYLVVRMSTCILPNSHAQSKHEANRNQMKNLLRHIISHPNSILLRQSY